MQHSNTKYQIREELIEQLSSKSIESIKVKDISKKLGISRSTFYVYYDSIYSVLEELEEEYITEFRNINELFLHYPLSDKYFKEPHPLMVKTLEYMLKNSKLTLVLLGPYGDMTFKFKCKKLTQDFFFAKAVGEHYVSKTDNLLKAFLINGHDGMINYWLSHSDETDVEQMAVIVYKMMFGFMRK